MADRLSGEVIEETRRYWQGRTGQPVSPEDAREAVRNVNEFFKLLDAWDQADHTELEETNKRAATREDNVNASQREDDDLATTGSSPASTADAASAGAGGART